jgi:protein TonB
VHIAPAVLSLSVSAVDSAIQTLKSKANESQPAAAEPELLLPDSDMVLPSIPPLATESSSASAIAKSFPLKKIRAVDSKVLKHLESPVEYSAVPQQQIPKEPEAVSGKMTEARELSGSRVISADDVTEVDSESFTKLSHVVRGAYMDGILRKIERNKTYPYQARIERKEGRSLVGFRVGADGGVDSIHIINSAGTGILDQAALQAVRRAAPFAEPPAAFAGGSLMLEVTLVFSLH